MKLASIILFAAAALAGCASSTAGTGAARPVAVARSGPSSFSSDGIDTWKMTQVNQTARGRGVDVIWVNAPRRR